MTIAGAYISFSITEPRGRLDEKDDADATSEPAGQTLDFLGTTSQEQAIRIST